MRKTAYVLTLGLSLLFLGAEDGCSESDPIVGSDDVFVLDKAQITVTEKSLSGSTMVAKGEVENVGSTKISPTWFVEGQFYSDSTYKLKLGGTNTAITFSLEPGEKTRFELRFSSSRDDLTEYPKFGVKGLRAVRNK
jgi:hypothetical protein